MQIKFKKSILKNLKELGKIYNYYIENTNVSFYLKSLSKIELKDSLFINDSRFRTFTIFFDNKICGFVQLAKHNKRPAYNSTGEVTIYIEKGYTNKGIGKEALFFIEKYAKSKKFHSLIATICGENIQSVKLFKKFGYNKCAYYKEIGNKFNRFLDVVAYQKIL